MKYFLVGWPLGASFHQSEFVGQEASGIQVLIACSFGLVHSRIDHRMALRMVAHFEASRQREHPKDMKKCDFCTFLNGLEIFETFDQKYFKFF